MMCLNASFADISGGIFVFFFDILYSLHYTTVKFFSLSAKNRFDGVREIRC